MKTTVITVFSILVLSSKSRCEESEESSRLMDNETVQNFIKQLVGLVNQGTSALIKGQGSSQGNSLNEYQDVLGYQRPIDLSGLDNSDFGSSRPPYYNRPYRPNFGQPGSLGGADQQGQLGNLLGLLGQGGLGQGNFGPNFNYGGAGNLGQFGQNGLGSPVPYPYPPRPPTQRPIPGSSNQQQSLFGALYSISQYDDLRCVPRLLCEVTAGSRPGGSYYPSYGQNQQASVLPFLSKDSLVTILTVLNFVDESPILVFGRAALLGYTARGDPRQCLTAYPLCPRNPDQLVDYLNNHNGGFFRFFNQQLPHIPQYAPYYQNNYQNFQGNYGGQNGFYNKQPYRKFKKFTKLYDTVNSKKYPQQYAEKNQRYYNEPRILYGKESDNKITFDTLPEDNNFNFRPQDNTENFQPEVNQGHRGGKKLKFRDEFENPEIVGPAVSQSNTYQTFFPSESQNIHTFSFPREQHESQYQHPFNYRKPKGMSFPDKTGTGHLVLEVDKYGNYVVRKDREEPLLESPHKVRFLNEYDSYGHQYYNKHNKRNSKRLYFPEDNKIYIA